MIVFKKRASRHFIKRAIMKRAFKKGDSVLYGVTRGIIIGIFTQDKSPYALFFSHEQREGFQTRDQITKNKNGVIDYLIKEHFGYHKTLMYSVLDQNRFIAVPLQDLKHTSPSKLVDNQDDTDRLVRKRHLYIQMAKSYMKLGKPNEMVHRICQCIENVQAEIELESKPSRNKTAFASYE